MRLIHLKKWQQPIKQLNSSETQLTYTITIESSSKVIFSTLHGVDQVSSVGQVGVRVMTSKVLLGDTVNC